MSSATQIQSVQSAVWESLQASELFRRLTPQQQTWTTAFCATGGNALEATRLSYNCASPKNNACLTYEIRRNKNILAFLELYKVMTQGAPSREEQIAGVLETIREAPAYEQVKARRLLAQLTGVVRADDDEAEPVKDSQSESDEPSPVRFKVGDIVLVDGVKHRVTAVDANGRATDGEPL
jgi:hypothetical protein